MIDDLIWGEQEDFNLLLRDPIDQDNEAKLTEFLKDMSLNVMSELDELLRTSAWKSHRRTPHHRPNRDHRLEELIDIFKLWMTMVQTMGYSREEINQAFWRKSMVVRQRHSEEFLKTLNRPAAVIDIDNVLCDYTVGFCDWVINRAPLFAKKAKEIRDERRWFGSAGDFGMSESEWQGFKHEFRSRGHKRNLPTMTGAREFLERVKEYGYYIILLTSRPIDRYPNIYSDTIYWLTENKMPFDWVWWSLDKKELLVERRAVKWIKFAVDDDPRYVEQFRHLGIKTFWLQSLSRADNADARELGSKYNVQIVHSLEDIVIPTPHSQEHPYGL